MGKKVAFAVVVGLAISAMAAMVWAQPATVCLKDGSGVKCLNVQGGGVVAPRIGALLRQIRIARQDLEDVRLAGNGKAGDVVSDVADLKKKLKDLEAALQQLGSDAKSGKVDSATALSKLKNVAQQLQLLGEELSVHRQAIRILKKRVRRLEKRRIDLEVGAFGAGSVVYGGTGGALVSLALPMGENGLWTTRLSGGLGVSPSVGLGWLVMGSLTRTLGKGKGSFGPALLAMGDQGELLGSTQSWVLAGGAELRLHLGPVHLIATPFLGVAMTHAPLYEHVDLGPPGGYLKGPCGTQGDEHARWDEVGSKKELKLDGGALFTIAIPIF